MYKVDESTDSTMFRHAPNGSQSRGTDDRATLGKVNRTIRGDIKTSFRCFLAICH